MSQTQSLPISPPPGCKLPPSCLGFGNSLLTASASPSYTQVFKRSQRVLPETQVTERHASRGKAEVCTMAYKVLVSPPWTSAPTHLPTTCTLTTGAHHPASSNQTDGAFSVHSAWDPLPPEIHKAELDPN